jgi:LacI family transcriptional regulator
VPDDMSLVTFDDLPDDWHDNPLLTVLAQPAYDVGRQAAELLLDRLEGRDKSKRRVILLPGELIVRRSSAPPAAATARAPGHPAGSATSS